MNDIRGLSDVSHLALVQFIGAYRAPDKGQVCIVMEYLDGGSLADLVKRVGSQPLPRRSFHQGTSEYNPCVCLFPMVAVSSDAFCEKLGLCVPTKCHAPHCETLSGDTKA